jgi:uncharacterized protein YqjF (DUF2071 family)
VLFVHFSVDAEALGRIVPFDLDLRDGHAYVSLVAFTQNRLRPIRGGRIAAILSSPIARHAFLNLRAYVRVNGEPAIYFISEWIPNRLAVLLGPRLYGLPYHLGSLRYRMGENDEHDDDRVAGRSMRCRIAARAGEIRMRATTAARETLREPEVGSLDHFLLERYVAWTHRDGVRRRFSVAHVPWPQARAAVALTDRSLLDAQGACLADATLVAANFSPGVRDVAISAPQAAPRSVPGRRLLQHQ